MKKKLIVLVLAGCLLTGCGEIPKLSNGQDALVEFGDGTKYSVDEVWKEVKLQYGLDVVLAKMDNKILEEEFKDKKDEVNEYVKSYETSLKANYVDENGKYDEESLNSALTQYGFESLEQYLEQIRLSYLQSLATTDYAKTKVTDKEIKNYYKNETVGDIHCLHILVKPDGDDDKADKKAKSDAEAIIAAIKKDIKSGTKAEDAFKKYEKDSSVTYQDLDYFNKGDMVKEFEKAAFALKNGAYSNKPVKTSYGYHVILRLDQKEKPSLDDVKEDIKETLADELVSENKTYSTEAMIDLRKKHGVEWHDKDLENAYNKYMNYLLNQANKQE